MRDIFRNFVLYLYLFGFNRGFKKITLFETCHSKVDGELYQLKEHTNRESNPDSEWSSQSWYEGDEGVPGGLGDGLHIERHEVHV